MPTGSTAQAVRYRHPELGKDIATGIAGYYTPEKEVRLFYKDREVLYVAGRAVLESSCCGTGNWAYAAVAGYVVGWHVSREGSRPVSEVLPIADEQEREELHRIIEDRESAELIQFL